MPQRAEYMFADDYCTWQQVPNLAPASQLVNMPPPVEPPPISTLISDQRLKVQKRVETIMAALGMMPLLLYIILGPACNNFKLATILSAGLGVLSQATSFVMWRLDLLLFYPRPVELVGDLAYALQVPLIVYLPGSFAASGGPSTIQFGAYFAAMLFTMAFGEPFITGYLEVMGASPPGYRDVREAMAMLPQYRSSAIALAWVWVVQFAMTFVTQLTQWIYGLRGNGTNGILLGTALPLVWLVISLGATLWLCQCKMAAMLRKPEPSEETPLAPSL